MRKKKASYFQKKSRPKNRSVPPKGSRGLLVTFDPKQASQAIRQVMKMCEEFSDPLPDGETGKELSLDEELTLLKTAGEKSRFVCYESDVSGNAFIRFVRDEDDPFLVLEKFFTSIREVRANLIPNVVRVYPIMASGFPRCEESLPILETLIQKIFTPDKELTYEVVIQRKHKGDGQELTHDELNKKIVDMVGKPHKPIFHGSDNAVLWLSLGRNLYMSVVGHWGEWCQFNIPRFCKQLALNKK